jgi:hypothetical protein
MLMDLELRFFFIASIYFGGVGWKTRGWTSRPS